MANYTAGPWTAQRTAAPYQQHAIWDALGRLVATTRGVDDGNDRYGDQRPGSPYTVEADKANAALLAAAPELLDAIKALSEEATTINTKHLDGAAAVVRAIFHQKLEAARAAIAKAEGQA